MNAKTPSLFGHFHNWLTALLGILVLGSFVACSSDSIVEETPTPTVTTADTYAEFRVVVSVGNGGRTTKSPNGGETGDGEELGTVAENTVERVTIFLFPKTTDAATGINDPDAANLTVHAFCWDVKPDKYDETNSSVPVEYTTGTQPLTMSIPYGTYQVLAVANEDLSSFNGLPLSELRDYIDRQLPYDLAATNAPTAATDFVMASAADATINIFNTTDAAAHNSPVGSSTDPYTSKINVERLAARLDFDISGSIVPEGQTAYQTVTLSTGKQISGYAYAVTKTADDGTTTATGDTFYLTAIVPFNTTQQQYLFKRVCDDNTTAADPWPSSVTRLGDEETASGGSVQTNYVVDPYFTKKPGILPANDDGFYTPTFLHSFFTQDYVDNILAAGGYDVKSTTTLRGDEQFFTIGYTSENTFPASLQADNKATIATGLRFEGYYVFKDGQVVRMHYDYYLRHSDPDNKAADTAVMKYGVVRNNIYRVKIGSVSPLEDFKMNLLIKVVPWQRYTHDEIVM